jgi:hypothetical protein
MLFKKFKNQEAVAGVENGNASQPQKAGENGKLKIYNLIILDKSGSMSSISQAAISGFNETVAGIRSAQVRYQDSQEHFVSLYVFCQCDKHYIYENVPVGEVKALTSKEYRPCCGTPLYDAMGFSLNKLLNQIQSDTNATVAVTVITDGLENASREYDGKAIKALVDKLKDEEGWNFAYIGTNQDVEAVAATISITNTMYFENDMDGMTDAWENERKSKMRMYDRMQADFDCCNAAPAPMGAAARKLFRAKRNREEKNYRSMDEFRGRVTPDNITTLKEHEIFVFGSNLQGMHAGGAARVAASKFGAVMGQGVGLQGQSYAIPTMQGGVETIAPYVDEFIEFAKEHPQLTFLVTRIGCGIAGFTDKEIAPLFVRAIDIPNVHLPKEFWKELV